MSRFRGVGPLVITAVVIAALAMAQESLRGRAASGAVEPTEAARTPTTAPAIASTAARVRSPAAPAVRRASGIAAAAPASVAADASADPQTPFSRAVGVVSPVDLSPLPAPNAVEVVAHPKSIQLIPVPVPLVLRGAGDVHYAIVPVSETRLLPPLTGVVPQMAVGTRPVMVAADVPSAAPAGIQTIAQVQYRQGGVLRQTVPVRMQVAQVKGAILRLAQNLLGARAGDRISIRYFLTNSGNAPDTIELKIVLPGGWRAEGLPTRYILAAGASVTGEGIIDIPLASGDGALRIRLLASSAGQQLGEADATVEVVRAGVVQNQRRGPTLTAGVASVLSDQATAAPVFGLELDGPLTSAVRVSGRLIQPTNSPNADQLGLARVGYFLGSSYLSLQGDRWSVTGGATGRTFSDITGLNVYGQGGSVSYDGPRWTLDALGASPSTGIQSGSGHLLGARVGAKIDGGWVGATATDFKENLFDSRELQAIGVGGVTPPFSGFTVSGELASRQYSGGSGLGWSADLEHHAGNDYVKLLAEGAPGGTQAFARASQEFSGTVSHGFGPRVVVAAGAWLSDDQNPAFSKLRSTGWTLAPQYDLTDHVTLSAELRNDGYDAVGTVGAFGNSETNVRMGATVHYGALYGTGALSVGQATRTTALGTVSDATSAGRETITGTGGWVTARGTFEANVSYEHDGSGAGFLPNQSLIGLRARQVSLRRDGGGPLLSADVEYYSWFGALPSVLVLRAGVEARIPGDLKLTVDVERNPLLTGRDAGWVPVVKVEHALQVPTSGLSASVRGVVYEDRDGNGTRDAGEPGIAGIVVRRGGETVVTDKNGAFTFRDVQDGPVRIDETSLPFGLVANPQSGTRMVREGEVTIGVWPTAVVTVQLVPTPDETGRMPKVDLRAAGVRAVDQAGAGWTATVDSTGQARFEALPPGTYRLELDLSDVREPVRTRSALPTFTIVPGKELPILQVPLIPRPVRLFDPTNQRGRGASRGTGAP